MEEEEEQQQQKWKIELHEKLIHEKIQRIETEERQRREEILRNTPNFEAEARRLIIEITNYDPGDRWQYRKGLRLMYLGTKLGNEEYKNKGQQFFDLACEKSKKG